MHTKKPLLVILFLLLASMACYSDSPLWVFGVTDTPPTATSLPQPNPNEYPAKLGPSERALAPRPSSPQQAFFFVTSLPEELIPGVRNASGSCEYGSELEVLYIGHEWQNFNGSVFVDNISIANAESSTTLYDFNDGASDAWRVQDDGIGAEDESLNVANDGVFNEMGEDGAERESNPALSLNLNFSGEDWRARFVSSVTDIDLFATAETLSAMIYVPADKDNFTANIFIRGGWANIVHASDRQALNPGAWNTISLDLSTIGNLGSVTEIGIEVGPNPDNTWYLVACTGTVGWAAEERIAGPVLFSRGESALTRPIDNRGNPIREGGPFAIYGAADSTSIQLPPTVQCGSPGDVVDVTDVTSIDQDLYYEIRCNNGSIGWVTGDRLFGPLVLPAVDGQGIVAPENGNSINLTSSPAGSEVVGSCDANTEIKTIGFNAIGEENQLVPYYHIDCNGTRGWAIQNDLLEIPYSVGIYTVLVGDEAEDVAPVEAAEGEDASDSPDEETATEESEFAPVPLTSEPAIAGADNIIGECPSGTTVLLENVATSAGTGIIFYQITCGDNTGWVEERYMPNSVQYEPGLIIYFMETTNAIDDPFEGFILDLVPSQVSTPVGACALYQPAEITNIAIEEKALARLGYRLYYEVSCLNENGEEIIGWSELELESDIISRRNPLEFLGN